jgi:recombination protein RecA
MARKKKDLTETTTDLSLESVVSLLRNYVESPPEEDFGKPGWFLPTGNLALDWITSGRIDGFGGYPSGKIIELYGEPSTGKSLLIAKAGASIQSMGGLFVIADAESRWDTAFASMHGVDKTKVVPFEPKTIEEFTVKAYDILDKSGEHKVLIALDSLAAISSIKEMVDMEDDKRIAADQGQKAKKIKASMRILRSKIAERGAILIVANHVMDNPNSPIPGLRTTPGGRGVRFHSSVRLEMERVVPIKLEGRDRPVGVTVFMHCAKNSVVPPYGKCQFSMFFSTGVQKYSGLEDVMEDLGILSFANGWFIYGEEKFRARGIGKFIEDHPEILKDPRWTKPYFLGGERDIIEEDVVEVQ